MKKHYIREYSLLWYLKNFGQIAFIVLFFMCMMICEDPTPAAAVIDEPPEEVEVVHKVFRVSEESTITDDFEDQDNEPLDYDVPPIERVDLGDGWTVTYYCSCEKCCGKYAEANKARGYVIGAEGTELVPMVSCASPLEFGTVLYIEGYGNVNVQDRTAEWIVDKYDGKIIDIYVGSDHEAAWNMGNMYDAHVWMVNND